MAETYEYHSRIQNESWLISHIENLITEAKSESSTSSVLYAAFEMRNLIEKICYDLILLSSNTKEWNEIQNMAKGKQGIRRSNSSYKSLRYRFQTFSEAIGKLANLPIKAFDYARAEELENELAEYVHTYTRTPAEMEYTSDFIQEGIVKVDSALKFVKGYFTIENGYYVYGILNFSTLTGDYKTEFEKWKSGTSTDVKALYERLFEINKKDPIVIKKIK